MATPQQDIFHALTELAGGDELCLLTTAAITKNVRGVSLRALEQALLDNKDPALGATLEAAFSFTRAVGFGGGVCALPYIQDVYAAACRDLTAPGKIFNSAAALARCSGNVAACMKAALQWETAQACTLR